MYFVCNLKITCDLLSEEENAIDPMLTKLPTEITLEHPNRNNIDTLFLYTQRVSSDIV